MSYAPKRDSYGSPYVSVFELGGAMYVITERRRSGFSAVKLNAEARAWVQSSLDDAHANLDALLLGFDGKLKPRPPG